MEYNKSRYKFRGGSQHTVYQLYDKDILDTLYNIFELARGGYHTVDETGKKSNPSFYPQESRSLKQIASQLGITPERVRQIEREALEKLRHPKRSKIMRTFL
jgi:hypothetical protein